MKRIGLLSFGHWPDSPYSQVRSASDALLQSIELAVAGRRARRRRRVLIVIRHELWLGVRPGMAGLVERGYLGAFEGEHGGADLFLGQVQGA